MSIAEIALQQLRTERVGSLFNIKTAGDWIKEAETQVDPKMLFSELWHEGELCFLFADTNVGKSILAVQIANAISKAQSQSVFITQANAQKVLYFDFELSAKQFQKRYSDNYKDPYQFHPNFLRIEMNTEYAGVHDFEKTLFEAIEQAVVAKDAKVLIIDNITYLKTQSTDTAKEALPLMNMLMTLKRKYGLSILALAHTPKRNMSMPITVNDLAGSKHLANFADSVFAIGYSCKGSNARYIKQIKSRATEKLFDSDYVIVCNIVKENSFLHFQHNGFGTEREHLAHQTEEAQNALEKRILNLHSAEPHLSHREIARQLETNAMRVTRVLKKYEEE